MPAVRKNNSFSRDRIAAGLSLEGIERELDVSSQEVEAWESGDKPAPHLVTNALDIMIQCKAEEPPTESSSPKPVAPEKTPEPDAAPDSLIKSKKRVADHGEVFTPLWLVEKMLDLVKGETERIESRFLEPTCGSGNFLVPILQRKLAAVESKYGKSDFEKRHYALLALSSVYGIELLADNIKECRANMLGGSEELTFIFYNVPSFLSGAHICLVIRNLRMNNGAV